MRFNQSSFSRTSYKLQVLRKLLSIVFLSVISIGIPALAVDYVACREMLRTKNELFAISKQYEDGEIKDNIDHKILAVISKRFTKCKALQIKVTSYEEATKTGLPTAMRWDKNDIESYYVSPDSYFECMRAAAYYPQKGFTTFGGAKWYEKALKVEADMKRANCPY